MRFSYVVCVTFCTTRFWRRHNQSFGYGKILTHLRKKLFSPREVTRGWFATSEEKIINFGGENAVDYNELQEPSTANDDSTTTNAHKWGCRNDISVADVRLPI